MYVKDSKGNEHDDGGDYCRETGLITRDKKPGAAIVSARLSGQLERIRSNDFATDPTESP